MSTDYDAIATTYKRAKQQPWRYFVERYTLLRLIGDIKGLSVLDLACGEGYYTRELKYHGAARVVGIDVSGEMVRLAREQEMRIPLGIEYEVGDARNFDGAASFDLVVAAYLLNYAATRDQLQEMCLAVARALRPGGRFVTVNNNPEQPADYFDASRKFGFIKSTPGPLREGAPIVYTIYQDEGSFDITNYWLSTATHEQCLASAGFGDVCWHRPQVSPEGQASSGHDFWEPFLAYPPITFLECIRGDVLTRRTHGR